MLLFFFIFDITQYFSSGDRKFNTYVDTGVVNALPQQNHDSRSVAKPNFETAQLYQLR